MADNKPPLLVLMALGISAGFSLSSSTDDKETATFAHCMETADRPLDADLNRFMSIDKKEASFETSDITAGKNGPLYLKTEYKTCPDRSCAPEMHELAVKVSSEMFVPFSTKAILRDESVAPIDYSPAERKIADEVNRCVQKAGRATPR